MQQPPPYYEMPGGRPRRNTNRTLWLIAAIILIPCCGCVIFGVFYGMRVAREMMPHVACFGKAYALNDAMQAYAKDHDGKLPAADKWQEELRPYVDKSIASTEIVKEVGDELNDPYRCQDVRANTQTRLVFNRDVSGKVLQDLDPNTILLFEVPGRDGELSAAYSVRPHDQSPYMIFYERRGWVEVGAGGKNYLLINEEGRLQRVPIGDGQNEFEINESDVIIVDQDGKAVSGTTGGAGGTPTTSTGQTAGSATGSE